MRRKAVDLVVESSSLSGRPMRLDEIFRDGVAGNTRGSGPRAESSILSPGALPASRYGCNKCKNTFSLPIPKSVRCKRCGSNYLTWINSEEVLEYIRTNDPDFKDRQ